MGIANSFVSTVSRNASELKRAIVRNKDRAVFLTSLVIGVGIIYSFGFHPEQVKPLVVISCSRLGIEVPDTIIYWQNWELGALAWSLATSMLFYLTYRLTGRDWLDKMMLLIVSGLIFVFHLLAIKNLFRDHARHILFILLVGVVFSLIDLAMSMFQMGAREKRESLESLLLADIPMVGAFTVFFFYQQRNASAEHLDIFLSGAISFQLVASTFIFAFIKAGVFGKLAEKRRAREVASVAVGQT